MKNHVDFIQYFDAKISDPKPADPEASQVADEIEYKWERKRAAEAAKAMATNSGGAPSAADGSHQIDEA